MLQHFFFNEISAEMIASNLSVLQQSPDSKKPVEIISYWHPNLTINLMDDQTPWVQGSVPPPMDECRWTRSIMLFLIY